MNNETPPPDKSQTRAPWIERQIQENPMKIYALAFLTGDIIAALNVLQDGSVLWLAGMSVAAATDLTKVVKGKGGAPLSPEDGVGTWNALRDMGTGCLRYARETFSKKFLRIFSILSPRSKRKT